jgi:hypothetical protein
MVMKATNVFALIGGLETGLTKSFGFMLVHNRDLLLRFLKLLGIYERKPPQWLKMMEVEVEVPDQHGRTDIELKIEDRLHLVLEGKVGGNLPSRGQLERYSRKLMGFKGMKKLVVITEVNSKDWLRKEILQDKKSLAGLPEEDVHSLTWQELHGSFFSCLDLNDELDRQFEDYFEEMIMQNEILVVSADPNLTYGKEDVDFFHKLHIYWYGTSTIKKRHNYIALYLPKEFNEKQGIQEIAKIMRYELCSLDQLGLPKDSNYYKKLKKDDAGTLGFYKLVLGEPIKLPQKIKKSRGKRVFNWTTTFEKLLKAEYADELLL